MAVGDRVRINVNESATGLATAPTSAKLTGTHGLGLEAV
ncbi:hypothetical protein HMPREF1051_1301 [Neisseria sicca VK64]|uniref:Uncharacterized protein n=1 Tax=Neisseria sicca VK64 TaxID=1095748 RepID=I2NX16_NEISI|nr:hypothetical protein HMPREF1051_1301 [Neisseria sicca VK64]